MLLEDLGPEGLLPPPPPVEERWLQDKAEGTFKLKEDLSRALLTTRSYSDSVALRESGALAEGSYFAYLLNTRRVTKVNAEGKRMSYSTLVVVGNGAGTAGVGMGKDLVAGNALCARPPSRPPMRGDMHPVGGRPCARAARGGAPR